MRHHVQVLSVRGSKRNGWNRGCTDLSPGAGQGPCGVWPRTTPICTVSLLVDGTPQQGWSMLGLCVWLRVRGLALTLGCRDQKGAGTRRGRDRNSLRGTDSRRVILTGGSQTQEVLAGRDPGHHLPYPSSTEWDLAPKTSGPLGPKASGPKSLWALTSGGTKFKHQALIFCFGALSMAGFLTKYKEVEVS